MYIISGKYNRFKIFKKFNFFYELIRFKKFKDSSKETVFSLAFMGKTFIRKTFIRKKLALIMAVGCILFSLTGCSGAKIDETNSPALSDVSVTTYNNGSEDSQYVEVTLQFDKNIRIAENPAENMRITIAEERMEPEEFSVEDSTLSFRLPVTAITRGNLQITEEKEGKGYPGITDEEGQFNIRTFTVDMLIPSGVTLENVDSYTGKGFRKKVCGKWNIRNITWLILTEDGTPVSSQMNTYLDNMDDAVALHGHDFLIYDATMIAGEMAETLTRHFGSQYIFRAEGDEIIGERLDGSLDTKLDLEIYEYKNIEVQ